MSPEDREASLAYLGALWLSYRTAVAEARGLTPDRHLRLRRQSRARRMLAAKGDAAKVALDAKLVTGLKSSLDVERRMVELVGSDSPKETEEKVEAGESDAGESYNSTSLEDYLRVVQAEKRRAAPASTRSASSSPPVRSSTARSRRERWAAKRTAELIREAREDDDVKAIVLRVDSPGGSVFASEQIYREVRAAQADGKPVVVSMGDLAASGGYYIAASADEIWAHPATITGSIGIFGAIPTFQNTLKKIGVNVDGVGTTNLSGPAAHRPSARRGRQDAAAVVHRARLRRVPRARRRRPQEDARRGSRHRAGPRVDRHRCQEQRARRSARPVRPGGEVGREARRPHRRLRSRAHRAASCRWAESLALQITRLVREERRGRHRGAHAARCRSRVQLEPAAARARALVAHERARQSLRLLLLRRSLDAVETLGRASARAFPLSCPRRQPARFGVDVIFKSAHARSSPAWRVPTFQSRPCTSASPRP